VRQNLGIRRRLAPLLDNDRRRIELANSLLFTLPGSPIIYYGDEIGMGDNIYLHDRNGLRTPMQWDSGPNAGFSSAEKLYSPVVDSEAFSPARVNVSDQRADPASLWHTIRRLVAIRQSHPAFGWGSFAWAEVNNPAVAAFWREHEQERLLAVHNLSGVPQEVYLTLAGSRVNELRDLLSGKVPPVDSGGLVLALEPYQYLWLERAHPPV
jgi:maltose alpha-D-glucosyltransferase/alpha-amylase